MILFLFYLYIFPLYSQIISPLSREFAKEFSKNYPGGPIALKESLQQRRKWTALELFDKTKVFSEGIHDVFNSLGPVIQCPSKLLNIYGHGDEEKRICGLMTDPCIVISLGSNNVWNFEEDFVKKHPECKVHTFDCFVPGVVPEKIRKSVTVHPICIGPKDEVIDGKQFLTWASLLKSIDVNSSPTALKMDIEGFEWTVIREMITLAPHTLLPLSISLELHLHSIEKPITWLGRYRTSAEVALFMEYLMKFGYVLVDRHDNPYCQHCSEIVVARV